MSELRWNPVMREWVATATHRQDRTFFPPPGYCPICPTEDGGFPTEVPASSYEFVVFENKFPSFRMPAPEPAVDSVELCPVMPATGVCEVVLYTSRHEGTLRDRPVREIERLVRVWQDRYADLGSRPGIDYVFIFENKGDAIGVTLPHPHGQIYAFDFMPPRIAREVESEDLHHSITGTCLHCDLIAMERREGRRIVAENEHFVAVVPFYARYPYEVHLYPKVHHASILGFRAAERLAFAEMLKTVMIKYDGLFGFSLPYMMVMHQAPTDGVDRPGSHFHVEFYPPNRTATKLKFLAGCESGAGTFINDTLPEDKAAELRAIAVELD